MTYLATNVFLADGAKTYWDFEFAGVSPDSGSGTLPYLYPADVKALELYKDTEGNAVAAERLVYIDPALPLRANIVGLPVAAGRTIKIYRSTEIRFPLVDYRDRQTVSEFDLDLANRQSIFVAQETQDAASNNMALDKNDNYDVKNRRIVNLAPGVDDLDAVNFAQLTRTIRSPLSGPALPELPVAALRAGKVLSFDSSGNPQVQFPSAETALGLQQKLASTLSGEGAEMIGYRPTTGPDATVHTALRDLYDSASAANLALQTLADGRMPVFESFAQVRAYAGNAKALFVLGATADEADEQGGAFERHTGTRDDSGVYLYGTFAWIRTFVGYVHAAWYGVKPGDWQVETLVDYTSQCQAAIDTGCVEFGGVVFVGGHILISAPLVFPNKAYDVRGSSGTRTEFICNTVGVRMLDFSANNGPAKTVVGIGCSTLDGGYKQITGFYTNNTNGLYLQNCWSRGLEHGLRFHGSFINLHNCAFEYCYFGVRCYTSCQESVWTGNTFYKNEQVDVWLTGDNATFTSFGSNHIGTRVEGWRIDGCNNATIMGITFENDGSTGVSPILVRVTGISSGNFIHGMQVKSYGLYAISVEGANVVKNRFTGLMLRNVQTVGNRAIRCVSSGSNYFEGVAEGWEAAVSMQSSTDSIKMSLNSNGVGCLLNASNYCTLEVEMRNNTTDFSCINMTILNLLYADADTSGLSIVPYIVTRRGYNTVVEVTTIPTGLSWKKGDRASKLERNPVAGTPKEWVRMTTGSAHVDGVDWLSVGNL